MRALVVVVLLAAAAGFVGFRLTEKRADEHRFAAIARDVARRDVSIHCQSAIGELVDVNGEYGHVAFGADGKPGGEAKLDRRICTALSGLVHGKTVAVGRGALAVEALAHEAYHLAGVQDEAATQCYALQAMRFVASRLGVSVDVGEAYVRDAYARYPQLPETYRSVECREGGALDLHPETGVFP